MCRLINIENTCPGNSILFIGHVMKRSAKDITMKTTIKDLATRRMNSRLTVLLIVLMIPAAGHAQDPAVNWIDGPAIAVMGDQIAQLHYTSEYVFADAADTRRLMQFIGNPVTQMEVGLIAPRGTNNQWFMIFEYHPIGYIKDAQKERIDADTVLQRIKKAADQTNKKRVKDRFPALNILGWHRKPYYDVKTSRLVWALLADENGQRIVNYNMRLLGRYGYVSAVLVTDAEAFASMSQEVQEILNGFSFKTGKTYAEYVKGDKLSTFGLTALIAGGEAAATTKLGVLELLAKGRYYILMIVLFGLSFVWASVRGVFRKKSETQNQPGEAPMSLPAVKLTLPEISSNPFLESKVKQLIEDGESNDALLLLKTKLEGKKIESLELAKLYYDLLKEHRKFKELIPHAKVYIDLLMDQSLKSAAREIYMECLAHDAKFAPKPDSFFKIAQNFAQLGDNKQAMNACLSLTKTYPEHAVIPEVYFFMAKVLNEKLNNKIKAKKIINWSMKKYPDHRTTPTARRYLAAIDQ